MTRKFFSPPHFEKDEDNFRAAFINAFAWISILMLLLIVAIYAVKGSDDYTIPIMSTLIAVFGFALYLLHHKQITASGVIIVTVGWLGIGIQAYTADGVRDVIIIGYIAISLLASIVISWHVGGALILASIGVVWTLGILEASGYLTPRLQDPLGYARDITFLFSVISVLIYFGARSMREVIRRAMVSEQEMRLSYARLQELNQTLEDRVASRTAELDEIRRSAERRAKQFEAIARVARETMSHQNLQALLSNLTQLISDQFGFYHVGIFLLDEKQEYAVLHAANSEGGKRMLARGHKLKVGRTGIVGYVAASGSPRIAANVELDSAYFSNPDLPNTRSEMALPLRIDEEIVGVLDVQSTEPNAFRQEEIETLAILADQISIAIQNARFHAKAQELLEEAQKVSGSYVRDAWLVLQSQEERRGFLLSGDTLKPLDHPIHNEKIARAIERNEKVVENGEAAMLTIPIRLRDKAIGVLSVRAPEPYEWDPDDVDIAEAVAERLSLAIETATLLKTTQRRAEIERVTAEVSSKISAATQFDIILRTAAEELSRAFGGSEVLVQIQPEMMAQPIEAATDKVQE
ncbi:MAG TPA: GAF domain-containing protein [Anaerolineales bacterium]|nr:GAF domain-containing protein [Anaerolineales bacterium]